MVLTCIWTTPSGDSLFNDHPLAHSMPGAGVVHHIKSAVLTVGRSLPVFPDQRTFSVSVGMSQRCHKRSFDQPRLARSGRDGGTTIEFLTKPFRERDLLEAI
jgi:hypothetical protein